jgi:predicted metal-dependent hydrolase
MTDNSEIAIDILRRVSRRSIGLHITPEGLVEVRAPHFVPMFVINKFVQSKREWILYTKRKLGDAPKIVKQKYTEGSVFVLGGQKFTIHLTDGNAIVQAADRLFFPKKFLSKPKKFMELWMRTYAKKYLKSRLDTYATTMGVQYKKISIRDTTSRWGSCSSTGTISFSYRLILAELHIIDYVVIHELSHIMHHNHQKAFWALVGTYFPEYKKARTWLRTNGHTLRI